MKHTPTIVLTPTTTDVAFPTWKYEIMYHGTVWESCDFVHPSAREAATAAEWAYTISVDIANKEANSYDF